MVKNPNFKMQTCILKVILALIETVRSLYKHWHRRPTVLYLDIVT
jgi:hypothetical protein